MFINLIRKSLVIVAFLGCAFTSQAGIIDNNDYTTDTEQGLDFLDINIFADNTNAFFSSGVSFGGRTWELATLSELNELFSNITGENVTSTSSHNFAAGGAKAVLDLVAGPAVDNSSWLHTANGGLIIHYDCCNDTHANTSTQGATGAWLVAATPTTGTSVPEPSTLAIFALGIMGLASRRFKKQ